MEVNLLIAFFSGLLIGGSPCVLLMLSTFGTSLILVEEKGKFLKIAIGLIAGMILTYVILTYIFIIILEVAQPHIAIRYIFGGLLIFIGTWQIIESKKDDSTIFGTPRRIKTILKNFIDKNSGFYSFLVGIIFVLIKIPCFGGVYYALLYNLQENPLLYLFIITYLTGMILPVIVVFILLRVGLESSKIDAFRVKYRTHLRILSGIILIFLAFYLLILDDLITAALSS